MAQATQVIGLTRQESREAIELASQNVPQQYTWDNRTTPSETQNSSQPGRIHRYDQPLPYQSQQQQAPPSSMPPREAPPNLHSAHAGFHGNPLRPQVSTQDTWSTGQQSVHVISGAHLANFIPQSRMMNNLVAISTIIASIVSVATLGITVWQVLLQKSQQGPEGPSSGGQEGGERDEYLPPDTGQDQKAPGEPPPSDWRRVQVIAVTCIGLVACLALGFSAYSAAVTSRRHLSDQSPSDLAPSDFAASTIAKIGHHTRRHARRAHDLVKHYHVRLRQVGADHWRFWVAPIQTVDMTKQRMEDDWGDNESVTSGHNDTSDVEPDNKESNKEVDTHQHPWEGEIRRLVTEEDSGKETSPEDFRLVDTHMTARSTIALGEEEVRRRFHEKERLLRKKDYHGL
ncbi:MAG: hypothetical protein LQ340_003496 [Diploschistes diacapsis]|nr:MAG: hypothetical protein LQ340_003496 [Diploschistes diacapsis]